jgi:DNA-binding CsgD family transcriptional regulator
VSVRTVVVAHRETLAAEGIAAALARYPGLVPVGVTTRAADVEDWARQADTVAIDARISGSRGVIGRLRKRGLRVVVIGGVPADGDEQDGITVAVDEEVSHLASALAPGGAPPPSGAGRLTRREEQILRLAAKGLACKQMARVLGISPKTVEQHKTRAFRRLGVPNQAAAVAVLAEGGAGPWSRSST